jgi:hypothetical protein
MAVGMRVTARCDQAVRAAVELAARRRPATGEDLALVLGVSLRSLHATLTQLTRALEAVTLADLAAEHLPESVRTLLVVTPEFTSPR